MVDDSYVSPTDTLQELEKALLAYLISNAAYAAQVQRQLEPEDFSIKEHQELYSLILSMLKNNPEAYGFITLQMEIDRTGLKIDTKDYQEYLGSIMSEEAAQEIVANILEESVKRSIKQSMLTLHSKVDRLDLPTVEGELKHVLDRLLRKGYGVSVESAKDIQTYIDDFIEFLTSEEELPIIYHIGINPVQPAIVDFAPSNLTVIGARPGSGKTTLMINSAYENANRGIPVHIFSYEMTPKQISARLVSMATGIEPRLLLKKAVPFGEDRVKEVYDYINSIPLRLTSPRAKTISELETLIRLSVLKYNTQIVYVDYLQLLSTTKRGASRYEVVSEASDMLMNIARELGVAVFVNSQLRRKAGLGSNYEPGIDDLKESGDIEQDASLIILLWQQEGQEENNQNNEDASKNSDREKHPDEDYKKVNLKIAKQRNSSSGQVYKLALNTRFTRFFEAPETR